MSGFDIEKWCASVPGLKKTGTARWEIARHSDISYPAGGHSTLAEIEAESFWFNHRNDIIAAAARNFPPEEPLFDIGGGNGYVSVGFAKAGFSCLVIEPGATGAANALSRGFAVIEAPFQDLQVPANSIPAAGLFDVLEHIENDRAALANLWRVLKPRGRLYIAVPAHRFLWSAEDEHAGHFRRYSLAQLQDRLREAGFQIEYGTYFFGILLLPIFLLRALPSRLGLLQAGTKVGQDHRSPGGPLGSLFTRSFEKELARVRSGRSLGWGASCLVVARKP